MKQTEFGWEFEVEDRELVTIRTRHLGVGAFATCSNPAQEIDSGSKDEQAFQFKAVQQDAPMEAVVMTFHFPRSTPGKGSYRVWVSGSETDELFEAGRVRQSSNASGSTRKVRPLLFHFGRD